MMRWRSATETVADSTSSNTTTTPQQQLTSVLDDSNNTTTAEESTEGDTEDAAVTADLSQRQAQNSKSDSRAAAAEAEPPDTADTSTDTEGSGSAAQETKNATRQTKKQEESDDEDDDGMDHAEEDSIPMIPWKPQNAQSTCEFTHTILDYSQKRESGCKKAEYSAVTQDEMGNRWRLIVYVNGNGRASNHHLSLFLQVADAEDLPFGWKKAVSYVLTLEHPKGGSLSYAKRNPDKTFKLCPKAIDWGWSQFVTSDRIQQEGFVKADTLTVRAQVTVKSSSVAIDEEDSELYLKCAVEEGDAASVKLCLDQGASVNCQFKDDLYTPLHTACSSATNTGSMEVLNLLLERGADGNACNKWRETPLLIAANNGHRAAVEALLKHGANPSLCSEAGWSALTFAAHKGYDDIVALLLSAGAPVNCPVTEDASTPLHKSCAGSKPGHLASVKLLLDANADVHALNKWRETPLLTAANHGQAGAVEALLAADADPCKCTDTGWSPLSIAAYKGHDDVVRLLLEEGAPTEEDDPTLSALLQAATKGLPDTVELLLRHGADHTVTTKKGDTALSILVEQNLIDAAVEMVTEYNASIPRCSRDRKKVQRARLLINLRMKQIEREGNGEPGETDDEETDDDALSNEHVAQHLGSSSSKSTAPSKSRKKKKKSDSSITAEEKARAAEEALLLELAQEDAQAKKIEAEASSKRAKKKKKKERERQLKMKEEEERRQQKELEAKERERIRKEKEEKQRQEREKLQKAEREREMKEMLEREKVLAAKRKEREERERRVQARKPQRESNSVSPVISRSDSGEKKLKGQKSKKLSTDPTPNRRIVSPKSANKPVVPLAGNRRWETASKGKPDYQENSSSAFRSLSLQQIPSLPQAPKRNSSLNEACPSTSLSPRLSQPISAEASGIISYETTSTPGSQDSPRAVGPLNGTNSSLPPYSGGMVEHPAITLFRRDKVIELLQRCAQALGMVDKHTLKRVLYRWIVRASHGQTPYIDPLIPSWTDHDQLIAYFQRQFISESRRRPGTSMAGTSMESLREAGSSVAMFCQSLAKQVFEFRRQIDDQLPHDWTDAALGMTASDGTLDGSGSVVTLSWANRAQAFIPSLTFSTLRDRHVGPPTRFLAAAFVARLWYETTRLIVIDSPMDFRLSPRTQASLSAEAGVAAELWSDPFSTLNRNVFWGHFEEIDLLFGGQKPFGKDEHGSEEVLGSHGGSLSAFLPLDTMIASKYVTKMVDILDTADSGSVPLSFAFFVNADCFHDLASGPSRSDLRLLDPRLGDQKGAYIARVEVLQAGNHTFYGGEGAGTSMICSTDSLFVLLQNDAGKTRYNVSDASAARIISSLSLNNPFQNNTIVTSIGLPHDFQLRDSPLAHVGSFDNIDPVSPDPQRDIRYDFGAIGGSAMMNTFSPNSDGLASRGSHHRGRLFDLVDDGDDVQVNDDFSGLLNLGLFQNANVGSDNVDIEAISLMGIGAPPTTHSLDSGNSRPSRLG